MDKKLKKALEEAGLSKEEINEVVHKVKEDVLAAEAPKPAIGLEDLDPQEDSQVDDEISDLVDALMARIDDLQSISAQLGELQDQDDAMNDGERPEDEDLDHVDDLLKEPEHPEEQPSHESNDKENEDPDAEAKGQDCLEKPVMKNEGDLEAPPQGQETLNAPVEKQKVEGDPKKDLDGDAEKHMESMGLPEDLRDDDKPASEADSPSQAKDLGSDEDAKEDKDGPEGVKLEHPEGEHESMDDKEKEDDKPEDECMEDGDPKVQLVDSDAELKLEHPDSPEAAHEMGNTLDDNLEMGGAPGLESAEDDEIPKEKEESVKFPQQW